MFWALARDEGAVWWRGGGGGAAGRCDKGGKSKGAETKKAGTRCLKENGNRNGDGDGELLSALTALEGSIAELERQGI